MKKQERYGKDMDALYFPNMTVGASPVRFSAEEIGPFDSRH
jgi:hypothetical protein